MIVLSNPVPVFAYKTGVKNIKKVINTESAFPMSLMTAFSNDKIKPRPSVRNSKGIAIKGTNKIHACGILLNHTNNNPMRQN